MQALENVSPRDLVPLRDQWRTQPSFVNRSPATLCWAEGVWKEAQLKPEFLGLSSWSNVEPTAAASRHNLSATSAMSQESFYSINAWARNRPGDLFDRLSSYSCSSTALEPSAGKNTPYIYASSSKQASLMVQRGDGADSNASAYNMSVPRTVPSLAELSASTRFSGSINTDLASEIDLRHILHTDDNDNLVAPTMGSPYTCYCMFRLLGCKKMFDNAEEWKTHVTSHFKLQPVPLSVACQICKEPFHSAENGEAWCRMLEHITTQHFQQGHTLMGTRPSYELMHYLYCKGIVSQEQLRLLQHADPDPEPYGSGRQSGVGSPTEPYFVSVNSRRERRMRTRKI
ncbi:predicted protein [Uncinocarpus reesii 1704]|uniref:Uncharacterized protein n=1 Tax=Uncinocarpus reesii (strain UAMH 1704) TaxID=336963 RepID=C4JXB7_UNCRE|nr:uncharacterized protein UREG_06290 [Uncinocarpus reesii 1704]EEP81425.1 predicted protein [Uncinocarpus reesii 1704]